MISFTEILTRTAVDLIKQGLFFPGKMLVFDWNLPYLEVNEIYKSDKVFKNESSKNL